MYIFLCAMWIDGSVVEFGSVFCVRWFELQWRRSLYTLLMRPNNVETAVQCFRMLRASVYWIFWSW